MDRREAIDVIRLMKHQLHRDVTIYDGFLFEALTQVIEKQHEALDLAIEALRGDFHCPKCGTIVRDDRQCHDLVYRGEAEPYKGDAESATTTDCISRQQAIEALDRIGSLDTEADREYARGILGNIPPVTPIERTGEWIPVKKVYRTNDVDFPYTHIEWETATDPDDVDAVRCSECGEVFDFADARNWCTECGAKMKEVIE